MSKEITYAMLAKHLGAEVAKSLCVTRWKDGIDIEEPIPGLQALMDECAAAGVSLTSCATCKGRGIIGGPSYSQPDEGGAPCPDCSSAPPLFLKGIGRINGDGHKDTTRKGEVVFVYAQELPSPYAPGQYPRVGNTIWSASTEQYDFTPATLDEVREHIEARLAADATTVDELARVKRLAGDLGKIVHDMTVAEQAAWIEWQHGRGAEAAMTWIHNGLAGPGHIPDEDEPYGKDPQAWFDANRADPFPTCFCGRPSNSLWMGKGFCSDAHYRQHRADAEAKKTEG